MNIPIIASSFAGIVDSLMAMGYVMGSFRWNRAPARVDGIWHAEVRHG